MKAVCPLLNQEKPQAGCHVWAGCSDLWRKTCFSMRKTFQGQSGSSLVCVPAPHPPAVGWLLHPQPAISSPPTALGLEPQRLGRGPEKRRDPLHDGAMNQKLGFQPQSVHPSPCNLRCPRPCPLGPPCPLRPQSRSPGPSPPAPICPASPRVLP